MFLHFNIGSISGSLYIVGTDYPSPTGTYTLEKFDPLLKTFETVSVIGPVSTKKYASIAVIPKWNTCG